MVRISTVLFGIKVEKILKIYIKIKYYWKLKYVILIFLKYRVEQKLNNFLVNNIYILNISTQF